MAIAGYSVNTTGSEEMGFALIPAGVYEFMFVKKEIRNKDGIVSLNLTLQGADGSAIKGRKLFQDIVLFDPKPDSGRPGHGRRVFTSIGKAVGYPVGDWTDQMVDALIGKRVMVDVRIEAARPNPRGGMYAERNNIETYYAIGTQPTASAAPAQPAMVPQMAPVQTQPMMQPMQQPMMQQPPAAPAGFPQQQPYGAGTLPQQPGAFIGTPPAPSTAVPPQPGQPSWFAAATS